MQKSLSLLFPSHSAVARIQPQSDFMDVRRLTFSPLLNIPSSLLFLSPPPHRHLLSDEASRSTGPAVTLDFKAPPHSSVGHRREGGHSAATLKEREGTRSEFIKKPGDKWGKGAHGRERGSAFDRREPRATKERKGAELAELLSLVFFVLQGVFGFHTHDLFPIFPVFYLILPSFLSLEPSVQRGVEACSFP